MNEQATNVVYRYLLQQKQRGQKWYIFSDTFAHKQELELNRASTISSDSTAPATVASIPSSKKRTALVELYNEVKSCNRCNLSKNRTKTVFGSGNANASIMVIGEAPGRDEDREGKPFVGAAGELLTKMLGAIFLDREKDVFITNILKCRPPENRDPSQDESVACMPVLYRQIAIIQPQLILALGRIASHELLNRTESVTKLRSAVHSFGSIPVIVTYHPAALLRNADYKRPTWEDLQRFKSLMQERGINGSKT